MKKKIILGGVILVVVAAIAVRIIFFGKSRTTDRSEFRNTVEYAAARRASVVKSYEVFGTIAADKTAQVFPETAGRVTKIFVADGARVSKGDRLIAIKSESVGFDFEEAYVTAPIDGAVARIFVEIGSMVAPPAPVTVIVDFARVKVAFNAAENEANFFSRNKRVILAADALPGRTFNAVITEISPVIDPLTRTVSIKAAVDNPHRLLKPGMTVRIIVTVDERRDVLVVPSDALLYGHIFVLNGDSTVTKRAVTAGLAGDTLTEITAGLTENENVIVVGQQRLTGNEKVNPVPR